MSSGEGGGRATSHYLSLSLNEEGEEPMEEGEIDPSEEYAFPGLDTGGETQCECNRAEIGETDGQVIRTPVFPSFEVEIRGSIDEIGPTGCLEFSDENVEQLGENPSQGKADAVNGGGQELDVHELKQIENLVRESLETVPQEQEERPEQVLQEQELQQIAGNEKKQCAADATLPRAGVPEMSPVSASITEATRQNSPRQGSSEPELAENAAAMKLFDHFDVVAGKKGKSPNIKRVVSFRALLLAIEEGSQLPEWIQSACALVARHLKDYPECSGEAVRILLAQLRDRTSPGCMVLLEHCQELCEIVPSITGDIVSILCSLFCSPMRPRQVQAAAGKAFEEVLMNDPAAGLPIVLNFVLHSSTPLNCRMMVADILKSMSGRMVAGRGSFGGEISQALLALPEGERPTARRLIRLDQSQQVSLKRLRSREFDRPTEDSFLERYSTTRPSRCLSIGNLTSRVSDRKLFEMLTLPGADAATAGQGESTAGETSIVPLGVHCLVFQEDTTNDEDKGRVWLAMFDRKSSAVEVKRRVEVRYFAGRPMKISFCDATALREHLMGHRIRGISRVESDKILTTLFAFPHEWDSGQEGNEGEAEKRELEEEESNRGVDRHTASEEDEKMDWEDGEEVNLIEQALNTSEFPTRHLVIDLPDTAAARRCTERDFAREFASCSGLDQIRLVVTESRRSLLLVFASIRSATIALRIIRRRGMGRLGIYPTPFVAYGEGMASRHLWVGSVKHWVREVDLQRAFEKHGAVKSITILRPSKCAFVDFKSVSGARRARSKMQGAIVCGSRITVDYSSYPQLSRVESGEVEDDFSDQINEEDDGGDIWEEGEEDLEEEKHSRISHSSGRGRSTGGRLDLPWNTTSSKRRRMGNMIDVTGRHAARGDGHWTVDLNRKVLLDGSPGHVVQGAENGVLDERPIPTTMPTRRLLAKFSRREAPSPAADQQIVKYLGRHGHIVHAQCTSAYCCITFEEAYSAVRARSDMMRKSLFGSSVVYAFAKDPTRSEATGARMASVPEKIQNLRVTTSLRDERFSNEPGDDMDTDRKEQVSRIKWQPSYRPRLQVRMHEPNDWDESGDPLRYRHPEVADAVVPYQLENDRDAGSDGRSWRADRDSSRRSYSSTNSSYYPVSGRRYVGGTEGRGKAEDMAGIHGRPGNDSIDDWRRVGGRGREREGVTEDRDMHRASSRIPMSSFPPRVPLRSAQSSSSVPGRWDRGGSEKDANERDWHSVYRLSERMPRAHVDINDYNLLERNRRKSGQVKDEAEEWRSPPAADSYTSTTTSFPPESHVVSIPPPPRIKPIPEDRAGAVREGRNGGNVRQVPIRIWRGMLGRGGADICEVDAYVVHGDASTFDSLRLKDVVDIDGVTDLTNLARHMNINHLALVLHLIPISGDRDYMDFHAHMLHQNKAGVANLDSNGRLMYILPVSDYNGTAFGITEKNCLIGAIIR